MIKKQQEEAFGQEFKISAVKLVLESGKSESEGFELYHFTSETSEKTVIVVRTQFIN